jgi:hypothetical protein
MRRSAGTPLRRTESQLQTVDTLNAEMRRARRSAEKIFCLCVTLRSLRLCVWSAFRSKRWRATAVQDAGAFSGDDRISRSVVECASPGAFGGVCGLSRRNPMKTEVKGEGGLVASACHAEVDVGGSETQAEA